MKKPEDGDFCGQVTKSDFFVSLRSITLFFHVVSPLVLATFVLLFLVFVCLRIILVFSIPQVLKPKL